MARVRNLSLRKKLALGLVVGMTVFGTVFAVAASLNVTSDHLSAGSAPVVSCDADGVHVAYRIAYSATNLAFVRALYVSGIDEACYGEHLLVQLTGADGPVGEASALGLASPEVEIELTHIVAPQDVTGVHVTMYEE